MGEWWRENIIYKSSFTLLRCQSISNSCLTERDNIRIWWTIHSSSFLELRTNVEYSIDTFLRVLLWNACLDFHSHRNTVLHVQTQASAHSYLWYQCSGWYGSPLGLWWDRPWCVPTLLPRLPSLLSLQQLP